METNYKRMTGLLRLTYSDEEVGNYLRWVITSDTAKEYWKNILLNNDIVGGELTLSNLNVMGKKNLKEAVNTVIEALKNHPEYYMGWKANIAMAFKDEFDRTVKESGKQTHMSMIDLDVHNIANTAADNFLNLLIK